MPGLSKLARVRGAHAARNAERVAHRGATRVGSDLVNREHSLQTHINGKRDAQVSLLGGKHTEEQAVALEKELGSCSRNIEN